MYSQARATQAGICPRADFLNQCGEVVRGSFDVKYMHIAALCTLDIAMRIVANVQTMFWLTASGGKCGLEHSSMRFGGSDLAGNDDMLKKAQQIVSGEDAAQPTIKIRQDEQFVITRQIAQSWQDIIEHRPGLRACIMLIKVSKQTIQRVFGQWCA